MPNAKVLSEKQAIVAALTDKLDGHIARQAAERSRRRHR